MRLLVNTPQGRQELIQVGNGGGYFDPSRVLWDERVDGEMPEITLGGMERVGDSLFYSQSVFDAQTPPDPEPETELDKLVKTLITKGVLAKDDAVKLKEVKK